MSTLKDAIAAANTASSSLSTAIQHGAAVVGLSKLVTPKK